MKYRILGDTLPVVEVELVRDSIRFNGSFQHLLVIVGAVVVENPTTHNHSGTIIYNHNEIGASADSVFRDVRQIAGITLPESAKIRLFECLSVAHLGVACRLEIIGFNKALYRADTCCGIQIAVSDKHVVNHGCVEAWKLFPEHINLLYGIFVKSFARTFVCADGSN